MERADERVTDPQTMNEGNSDLRLARAYNFIKSTNSLVLSRPFSGLQTCLRRVTSLQHERRQAVPVANAV